MQTIRRDPYSRSISCFFEDKPGQILNSHTGETLAKYRGPKDVYFSYYASVRLEEHAGAYRLCTNGDTCFTVKAETFGILDVGFSPSLIAISEAGGAVRFYSIPDGRMTGRYSPDKGYHVLSLAFDGKGCVFVGLLWGYESSALYYLVHLQPTGEELKRVAVSDCYAVQYLDHRHSLLNANGEELDWATGQVIFHYDFPPKVV